MSIVKQILLEASNIGADTQRSYERIIERLQGIYVPSHSSYKIVQNVYNNFLQAANTLQEKNPTLELKFDFDASWYEKKTKASLRGYFGINKMVILRMYRDEINEEKKKYSHFVLDGFVADKLKEIAEKSGVKAYGSSSAYTESGGSIYLEIANGEI